MKTFLLDNIRRGGLVVQCEMQIGRRMQSEFLQGAIIVLCLEGFAREGAYELVALLGDVLVRLSDVQPQSLQFGVRWPAQLDHLFFPGDIKQAQLQSSQFTLGLAQVILVGSGCHALKLLVIELLQAFVIAGFLGIFILCQGQEAQEQEG